MSDNVYSRLQRCRVALSKTPIKESGNNKFAGYTYVELGDFLPHITSLCHDFGLCPAISFDSELATLTVTNIDKPDEKVVFTSPMSTAELKGCHAIQNLGAVETYLRRYLYVAAFDIVEHDALDSTHGKETKQAVPAVQEKSVKEKCRDLLIEIYGTDYSGGLVALTAFTKDGKNVPGKSDLDKINPPALPVLLGKLRDLKKEMEAANAKQD